mmetsp:Transcript_32936/g.80046  ORF Transcript_32936/g.80046 Transcript_32936/m.80046 type:complete len:276 (+) Transcript_32936:605-1432(+)
MLFLSKLFSSDVPFDCFCDINILQVSLRRCPCRLVMLLLSKLFGSDVPFHCFCDGDILQVINFILLGGLPCLFLSELFRTDRRFDRSCNVNILLCLDFILLGLFPRLFLPELFRTDSSLDRSRDIHVLLSLDLILLGLLPGLFLSKLFGTDSRLDSFSDLDFGRFLLVPLGLLLGLFVLCVDLFGILFRQRRHALGVVGVHLCLRFTFTFLPFLLLVLLTHSKVERGHTLEGLVLPLLRFPLVHVVFGGLEVILRVVLTVVVHLDQVSRVSGKCS